jgi:hypothetical protein
MLVASSGLAVYLAALGLFLTVLWLPDAHVALRPSLVFLLLATLIIAAAMMPLYPYVRVALELSSEGLQVAFAGGELLLLGAIVLAIVVGNLPIVILDMVAGTGLLWWSFRK